MTIITCVKCRKNFDMGFANTNYICDHCGHDNEKELEGK